MLVSEESLFFTEENMEEMPFRRPWMMLTPAFHSHDPAPEKMPLIRLGRLVTNEMTPLTPEDTADLIPSHAADVPDLMRFHPPEMTLPSRFQAA